MRIRLLAPVLLISLACNWGTSPAKFRPAQSPEGAEVVFSVKGDRRTHRGELLAVHDDHFFVRSRQLLRVRWDQVSMLRLDPAIAGFHVYASSGTNAAVLERLTRVSRFPQGLSGPLLESVLAAMQQSAVGELP